MPEDVRGRPSSLDTGTWAGRDELALVFSEFARTVQQQPSPGEALVEIVKAAVELVPGCDEGSISVVLGRRTVTSQAASGELPRAVDEAQVTLGEGPCLDAAHEHETVRVPDLAGDSRWPRFSAAAVELGALGMMCFQLYVEGDDLGALNLFARTAFAFDDESEPPPSRRSPCSSGSASSATTSSGRSRRTSCTAVTWAAPRQTPPGPEQRSPRAARSAHA